MAQQHYEGKKHRRNAARARLLEQLAGSLDATESTGQCPNPGLLTSDKSKAEVYTGKDDKREITVNICSNVGAIQMAVSFNVGNLHICTEVRDTSFSLIKLAHPIYMLVQHSNVPVKHLGAIYNLRNPVSDN